MADIAQKTEEEVLRVLRERYERDGYTFIMHPTSDMTPSFLSGYLPDAIAISKHGSVAIEVKSRSPSQSEGRISEIARRVLNEPNWDFKVYYAGNFTGPIYDRPTYDGILELLKEVRVLQRARQFRAALVMGWAALEALARAQHPESARSGRPMIPSEAVESLAQSGHISAASARTLKSIIKVRNAVVHGDVNVDVRADQIADLLIILDGLAVDLGIAE